MINNITNVKGIKCWGAHIGVKSMRRDLAIIYSEVPASAAATFTQNKTIAEPLKISKRHIADGIAQAIVINAGNANACTGEQGRLGAKAMVDTMAEELKIKKENVIVASTGLIGEPFPTKEIVDGIRENANKISNKSNAGSYVANAILTTDTFPKEGFVSCDIDGKHVSIAGIAKGSGMIHPNMATMLAFIVTDVAIDPKVLNRMVKKAVDRSFNMITVDGDTSTNDMVVVMANGMAGNTRIKSKNDPGYRLFEEKLQEMMAHLAKMIVSDGEGASKFIEYEVKNAPNETIARMLVREISDSNLVKTAMFGRDANWGRIVCAAGNAGVDFDYEHIDLYLGDSGHLVKVLENGRPQDYDKNYMKKLLRESHVKIQMNLKSGKARSVGWGADLTTDYVLFNSVYTT